MRNLAFLIMAIIVIACDPTVVFTEPQPEGKKNLENFPARYRGTYMEVTDSSIYIVTADRILQRYEEFLAEPEEEILKDGDVELLDNRLVLKGMNQSFPITRRNDSIFGMVVLFDTIFDLNGDERLRKLGNNYLMNIPHEDSLWIVFKLIFDSSGGAYLCDVDDGKEMELFEQLCKVEVLGENGILERYMLSPTKRELKKLLKLETFTDTTEYRRISPGFQW